MSFLNQVMIIGNVGKNPEVLKQLEQGDFVRLSIATTKKYRDKQGVMQLNTQWHTVYLSNKLGTITSKYVTTGAKVFISGELRTSEWQDKEGNSHSATAIYAHEIKFLSFKQAQNEMPETIDEESIAEHELAKIRETLNLPSKSTAS